MNIGGGDGRKPVAAGDARNPVVHAMHAGADAGRERSPRGRSDGRRHAAHPRRCAFAQDARHARQMPLRRPRLDQVERRPIQPHHHNSPRHDIPFCHELREFARILNFIFVQIRVIRGRFFPHAALCYHLAHPFRKRDDREDGRIAERLGDERGVGDVEVGGEPVAVQRLPLARRQRQHPARVPGVERAEENFIRAGAEPGQDFGADPNPVLQVAACPPAVSVLSRPCAEMDPRFASASLIMIAAMSPAGARHARLKK